MPRFYTRNEVQQHCTEEDAYVSAGGRVLDLTPLLKKYRGSRLCIPLVKAAGTDITHWFKPDGDLKTCVDVVSGLVTYATPHGRFVHCPTTLPDTTIDLTYDLPWWEDPAFEIGQLTSKSRILRIVNTLTGNEVSVEVCSEETLKEVMIHRYLPVNAHAGSYTWKRHSSDSTWTLDMDKTLEGNGILDESAEFESLGLSSDYYVPAVHLYFNDDLTVA